MYDVIVIGLGGMGSSTLYHLAKKGVSVLGIEQYGISHSFGSSHGHTRVIRKAYFEHPSYVPMLEKSYQLWNELENESGNTLLNECGMIYAGQPDSPSITGVMQSSALYNIPIETLPQEQLKNEYACFSFDEKFVGLYEATGGFLYVEDCTATHCEQAKTHGAQIHTNTAIQKWEHKEGVFHVHTNKNVYQSKKLVVCAGAWTNQILNTLDLPLTIQRIASGWFQTASDLFTLENGFPVFGIDTGKGFYYGFPVLDDRGIKIAQYEGKEIIDHVDHINRSIKNNDLDHILRFITEYMPDVTTKVNDASICIYTVTPDQHFIIDQHPDYENLFIAAGFSRHGFKFSSAVGSILSELAVNGKSELDIDFFSLSRFNL